MSRVPVPYPVVLASRSPRRIEILARMVDGFEQDPAEIDEESEEHPDPWIAAETLAFRKASAVAERWPEHLVVAGDTIVALPTEGGKGCYEFLSKPADAEDAKRMMVRLSGRDHLVVTGCCLMYAAGSTTFSETSVVRFRTLSEDEIAAYVASGEPMDKAGGYGIQGLASTFAEVVEGSRTNVIGLPEERLRVELEKLFPRS